MSGENTPFRPGGFFSFQSGLPVRFAARARDNIDPGRVDPTFDAMKKTVAAITLAIAIASAAPAQAPARHTFALSPTDFLLDGVPFQIKSGEMHPSRIPVEYWRHRIRMAKAMGLNTIAAYIFWNYHEPVEGTFDFTSGNHDIARFIRIAQEEGMWVLLRPGPYVCAEWDFGGLPPYLLRDPELAAKLEEVCPVDIFKAGDSGVEIVVENLDECVLCYLCVDAAPDGAVSVIKLYER